MALTTCHECEKQISSEATACPNCGAPNKNLIAAAAPATASQPPGGAAPYQAASATPAKKGMNPVIKFFGYVLVILFGWHVVSAYRHDESAEGKAERDTADAQCKTDLQCTGDKYTPDASFKCYPLLVAKAKEVAKWDFKIDKPGVLSPIVDHFHWADPEHKQIIFSGDKAKFQNGFGAWSNYSYSCLFDLESEKPVSVEFNDKG